MKEEKKFQTDYFSYLEQIENSTRYTIAIDYLNRIYKNTSFDLLDLGCGNGILSKYIDSNTQYIGLDHNKYAIEYANSRYKDSNKKFIQGNNVDFLEKETKEYDAIVLCGILYHVIDINSNEKYNDVHFLESCLKRLKKNGYLIVIAPFAYTRGEYDFLKQANWKYDSTMEIISKLDSLKEKVVFENIAKQLKIENYISQQDIKPEWFIEEDSTIPTSRFHGKYLGSWTIIIKK
ncbi:class I SAM-dependent methyltransferase [Bacillus cereus]|uniref:class I SAM-dependent methyltransferase n=1 Tax=Bacillus cereus TaxID=1396 RepID=UPI000BF6295A|nr:class I SAM-dependent methyltransferase [Bacillus cereus]PER10586.1 hypothetical protein CN489_17620 [Bacillus cereus]PFO99850.1 hypothetical protein COJ97_15125 [Bacillus cereus]